MDHAHLIDLLRHSGEEIRDPATALTVSLEFPRRLHDMVRRGLVAGFCTDPVVGKIERLAIFGGQAWLVVEGIDVAWPSLHENEDNPLGARREVRSMDFRPRGFSTRRPLGGIHLLVAQSGQRQGAKTTTGMG